jgi:hypothetical protein
MMTKIISKRGALACLFMSLIFIGCEEHPSCKVSIDDKAPPTFTIRSYGSVYFVRILKYPVKPKTDIYPSEAGIWQLERKGIWYRDPAEIKYGIVPDGFIQKVPKDGSAPPALKEGEEYLFFAPTLAHAGGTKFKIENGKTVVVN